MNPWYFFAWLGITCQLYVIIGQLNKVIKNKKDE